MVDIRDQYGFGSNVYPKILAVGHNILKDHCCSENLHPKKKKTKSHNNKTARNEMKGEQDTGIMYSQQSVTPGDDGTVYPTIKCHGCNSHGHYLSNRPDSSGKPNLNLKEESEDKE